MRYQRFEAHFRWLENLPAHPIEGCRLGSLLSFPVDQDQIGLGQWSQKRPD
jgi:hypothetical protein